MIDTRSEKLFENLLVSNKSIGSVCVQIVLFSKRISVLTEHLKLFKNDSHSKRGLINIVNKRKKLLKYIKVKNEKDYISVITFLGLRK